MSGGQDPVGTLEVALQHATRLLGEAPALAIEQADEILKQVPRHPLALLIQGIAKRKLGDLDGALAVLEPLAASQPGWAPAHYEIGVTFGLLGRGDVVAQGRRKASRGGRAGIECRARACRIVEWSCLSTRQPQRTHSDPPPRCAIALGFNASPGWGGWRNLGGR